MEFWRCSAAQCALADRLRVQCQITTSSARPSLRPSRRRRGCQFLLRRLATGHGQRAHKRQSKQSFSSLTGSSLDQSAQIGRPPMLRHWSRLPEGGLGAKPGTQLVRVSPASPNSRRERAPRHSAEREGSPRRRFRVRARDRLRYQCAHRPGDPHRSVPNSRNWRAKRRERRRGSALSASPRAVSRQNGVDDFRYRISPSALMIHEQKQWRPTSPQSARPQY
jgi:hypothetical protein